MHCEHCSQCKGRYAMHSDSEKYKKHILEVTTDLLKEYDGDTKKITSRIIADKAGIGLGSINHFFGSKDNLIAECIQRSIHQMLAGFTPDITDFTKDDGLSDKDRLLSWAIQTFDFLFENPAVSRISILSDMQNYTAGSNSVYTQKGFRFALRSSRNREHQKLSVFLLVSAMQTAFLAKNAAKEVIGYDFSSKAERDLFISDTITMLLHNVEHMEDDANEK